MRTCVRGFGGHADDNGANGEDVDVDGADGEDLKMMLMERTEKMDKTA